MTLPARYVFVAILTAVELATSTGQRNGDQQANIGTSGVVAYVKRSGRCARFIGGLSGLPIASNDDTRRDHMSVGNSNFSIRILATPECPARTDDPQKLSGPPSGLDLVRGLRFDIEWSTTTTEHQHISPIATRVDKPNWLSDGFSYTYTVEFEQRDMPKAAIVSVAIYSASDELLTTLHFRNIRARVPPH